MKPMMFDQSFIPNLLDGSKTMTRRLVKPQPVLSDPKYTYGFDNSGKAVVFHNQENLISEINHLIEHSPHKLGDIVWVPEDFYVCIRYNGDHPEIWYRADNIKSISGDVDFVPSRLMPEEYSRIHLKINEVRVERVQNISEDDAKSEGVNNCYPLPAFKKMWGLIYGDGAWERNDWVFVYGFERCG